MPGLLVAPFEEIPEQAVCMQAFALEAGKCTMYSERMEFMGAHAAVQVLQVLTDSSTVNRALLSVC
jgi:hypothetical protein